MKNIKHLLLALTLVIATGCTELRRVPDEQFLGVWELKGRSMFDGLFIKIARNEKGKLMGRIIKLNDNKYVKMFAQKNDVWISNISRSSDFQFRITEKKIAHELFSLYGIDSSTEFKAEFIDENVIGISRSSDPIESSVTYKRVE